MIIRIGPSRPFDPAKAFGHGWRIWCGPAKGSGLDGPPAQSNLSLALDYIDIPKLRLETCLREWEDCILGDEKVERLLHSPDILIDCRLFQAFRERDYLIPKEWMNLAHGKVTTIAFPGQLLRSPSGGRYEAHMSYYAERWHFSTRWLKNLCFSSHFSLVLPVDYAKARE